MPNPTYTQRYQAKGYTRKSLAKRWGLSERQIARIAASPRQLHDDALEGLPSQLEQENRLDHLSSRLTALTQGVQLRTAAFQEIKENREKLLKQSINHVLGRTDWTAEEIRHRGERVVVGHKGAEYFTFDGVKLFELGDIEESTIAGKTTLKQPYKRYY